VVGTTEQGPPVALSADGDTAIVANPEICVSFKDVLMATAPTAMLASGASIRSASAHTHHVQTRIDGKHSLQFRSAVASDHNRRYWCHQPRPAHGEARDDEPRRPDDCASHGAIRHESAVVNRGDSRSFSNATTFMRFPTVVAGTIVPVDLLGVTSIVRALNLRPELLLRLFHSTAVKLDRTGSSAEAIAEQAIGAADRAQND
jgi:hypothetical protein